MASSIKLLVGLGNPGDKYTHTRHNAGAWLVERFAQQHNSSLTLDKKFFGFTAKVSANGQTIWLLNPTTYMNRSGQAVGSLANFYKIPPEDIIVAHDELDFEPGIAKFKQAGGHGGHNGLRDIISSLGGSKSFYRIRIGIGHPGDSRQVADYVLTKPSKSDLDKIDESIDQSLQALPEGLNGQWQKAMNILHG